MNQLNIVLIFADQMHKYALGKLRDFVLTPNLDRLCEEGVLFTSAYSNNPLCGPYRGCLFTGLHTSYNKVYNNEDPLPDHCLSMAEAFNKGGYETSFVGKWHLGGKGNCPIPVELRGGFKHFTGYQCYNGFYKDVCFYDESNTETRYHEHREDVATRLAVERLKMLHATGKPFLHVVAYQAPHYPVQPSPQYESLYAGKTIPYDPDYQETEPYTPTFSPYSPRPFENCPDYVRYGGNMQEYLRLYYAMVSQIDAGVGEIVKCLEEMGIRDQTAIVFTSDHGDMQGSHGLRNKGVSYEKSCGVPFIVSVPGGRKNVLSDALVSGIDLFPTFLEYAQLPAEPYLQGKSIAPYTLGKEQSFSSPVFAENLTGSRQWKMVRHGKYKLTVDWPTQEAKLLFDMEKDPFEMENLVDREEYGEVIREMKEMMGTVLNNSQQ